MTVLMTLLSTKLANEYLNYPSTIRILPQIAEASCVHQHRILCASDTLANFHPSKLRITIFTNKEEENKG
jgi:hypothetical protein